MSPATRLVMSPATNGGNPLRSRDAGALAPGGKRGAARSVVPAAEPSSEAPSPPEPKPSRAPIA